MRKFWANSKVRWIVVAEAAGLISGFLSRKGMQSYDLSIEKAPLTPPGWVFPVVWTLLYGLMGYGAGRISDERSGKEKSCCMNIFIVQLFFNFFWPLIFFNAQAFGGALVWLALLWCAVLFMTLCFSKVDRLAAKLQIPYLIWLTFAAYLNAAVWRLNS